MWRSVPECSATTRCTVMRIVTKLESFAYHIFFFLSAKFRDCIFIPSWGAIFNVPECIYIFYFSFIYFISFFLLFSTIILLILSGRLVHVCCKFLAQEYVNYRNLLILLRNISDQMTDEILTICKLNDNL